MAIPTRGNPGRSRTALCVRLASQWLTTHWAVTPVPQARSSPKKGPRAPAVTARLAIEPWAKYWRRIMSAECPRATRTSRKSTRRWARPRAARTEFIVRRSEASEPESVRAWAPAAGQSRENPAMKAMRSFFWSTSAAVCGPHRTEASPKRGRSRSQLAGRLGQADPKEGQNGPCQLHRFEGLIQPGPGHEDGDHGLQHPGDSGPGGHDVAQGADDEEEWHDRPQDDHPEHQEPDRQMARGQVPEQRDVVVHPSGGEAPPRREHRPEDRREQKAPGRQRDRVASPHAAFGQQDVRGVCDRCDRRRRDTRTAQTAAVPDLDDQGQTSEREGQRGPDSPPDRLVEDEPRPERDEDRADELDEESDPDLEPVDRKEVRPLHKSKAADAESDEQRQFSGAGSQ